MPERESTKEETTKDEQVDMEQGGILNGRWKSA